MENNRRQMVGDAIREHREEQGLSLERLANMAGVSFAYIWRVEKGKVSVGLDVLCRIADALGVSVRELIAF